jgi:hypothetical protein
LRLKYWQQLSNYFLCQPEEGKTKESKTDLNVCMEIYRQITVDKKLI